MRVDTEDIIATAEGVADPKTERRVLAAALSDPDIRAELLRLRAASAPDPTFADRAERLRQAMHAAARAVAAARREGGLDPTSVE